jgi:hypothetical protein
VACHGQRGEIGQRLPRPLVGQLGCAHPPTQGVQHLGVDEVRRVDERFRLELPSYADRTGSGEKQVD